MRAFLWDRLPMPTPVPLDLLRHRYFEQLPAYTFHLVSVRGSTIRLGPISLIEFGAPKEMYGGLAWPIRGGFLARRPGGHFGFTWRHGELSAFVEDYLPLLPRWLYSVTQLPFHQAITRRFLRDVRAAV